MRPRKINKPQVLDPNKGSYVVSSSLTYKEFIRVKIKAEQLNQSVAYRIRQLLLEDLEK